MSAGNGDLLFLAFFYILRLHPKILLQKILFRGNKKKLRKVY